MLKLSDINKKLGDFALSGISLSIPEGQYYVLLGRSGAGKTQLLELIAGLEKPDSGTILLDGEDITHRKIQERKIGIVFQDFQLLTDRSVNENLGFVLKATGWKNKAEIETRIGEVLEKVGLGLKGYKMPHQLSGGEQQRVVIGRALLNDPEIILADEPTGNLDPETSEGILKLLTDISRTGRAVIVATHNYTLLKKFTARTIKCENGEMKDVINDEEMELLL